MISHLHTLASAPAIDARPLSLELRHALIAMDIESEFLRFNVDDSQRGSRQPAPHVREHTQQGATTPGHGESRAAGNVAESHCAPVGRRSAGLSSTTSLEGGVR